jgi:hypothetical protein
LPDELQAAFDLLKHRRPKKRLIEVSVGTVEIEFVGERWGTVTLFDLDGRVRRQVDFNDRLRGLGTEGGLKRSLHEIGLTDAEGNQAQEMWNELSSPTDWPPPTVFLGVFAYVALILLGVVTLVWGLWEYAL